MPRSRSSARRTMLVVLGALCAGPVAAQSARLDCPLPQRLPPALVAVYEVSAKRGAFALPGESTLRFRTTAGQGYELSSETRSLTVFRATQRSQGRVQERVLIPAYYAESRTGRSGFEATFDWSRGILTLAPNSQDAPAVEVPTQPLLQDRLTLLLQVGWTLQSHAQQSHVALPVAGSRRISVARFERRGEEALDLPAGPVATLKLERPLDPDNDRIEVWIAPALCWLPVRIRYTDRHGGVIDHRLRAVNGG
ncbi:MAG TPA: DUF3108 domain-containing protein [Burkholderiaceae bacterium]|nr:DUF3108 domain-containing protein [Burkholderiaceae bacterium]